MHGAQLGQAVFYIVERHGVNVQFAVPAGHHHILQTAPIDSRHETLPQATPGGIAVGSIRSQIGVLIHPVLEGIHHGHIRPEEDVALQMFNAGAGGFGGGVIATLVAGQIGRTEQFHAHRGNFRKFHGHDKLRGIGQVGGLKNVHGVTALMQKGLYIIMNANGVFKHKRAMDGLELGAVGAGSLVLAVDQIHQVFAHHGVKIFAQLRVHFVENG